MTDNELQATIQDWDEFIKAMLKRYPDESKMLIEGIVGSRIATENKIRLEQIEKEATGKKKFPYTSKGKAAAKRAAKKTGKKMTNTRRKRNY